MKIIKLNAIESTNTFLINLSKRELVEDKTLVISKCQTKGRGQMGESWHSNKLQSLTFSVFKTFKNLSIQYQSNITYAVSIGLLKAMENFLIPNVSIKWPNDIMSHTNKMAGILIENKVKNSKVINSVIGIGLNVNEEQFNNLPQATSMFLATNKKNDLDEVLKLVSESIFTELDRIEKGKFNLLKNEYENYLFRKERVTVFTDLKGNHFNGIIRGVSDSGELKIENEDNLIMKYNLKEIRMLF